MRISSSSYLILFSLVKIAKLSLPSYHRFPLWAALAPSFWCPFSSLLHSHHATNALLNSCLVIAEWIPALSLPNVILFPLSYLSFIKTTFTVFPAFPVHYGTHLSSPCRTDPSLLPFAPHLSVNLCTNHSFHRYRCYYELY